MAKVINSGDVIEVTAATTTLMIDKFVSKTKST